MIGSVAQGRRALAFARALDEHGERTPDGPPAAALPPGEPHPGNDRPDPPAGRAEHGSAREDDLVPLAAQLASLPRPELDPGVKEIQRAQLIAAMERELSIAPPADVPPADPRRKGTHRAPQAGPPGVLRPGSRLARGLTAGGLGVGVAAGALGGVSAASGNALPGDSLYGMKRGMEEFTLDLTGDDAERGRLHLDHASTRLKEARRLMEAGRGGSLDDESLTAVRRTLKAMGHDAGEGRRLLSSAYEQGGELGPMRSLSSFSEQHRSHWSQLKQRLPAELGDVTGEISSVFDAMDGDVAPVRALLRGTPAPGNSPQPGSSGESPGVRESAPRSSAPHPPSSRPEDPSVREESGSPSGPESGRGEAEEEGLLGGGVLGPSAPREKSEDATPDPEGGVTLPPVLPEILPGLGDLSGGSGR